MATLYVTEFGGIRKGTGTWDQLQAPFTWTALPSTEQVVNITGSSSASAAFQTSTILVRVHADAICSVKVGGTSPTATTTCARLVAGQTEYYAVQPGEALAVIQNV